MNHGEFVDRQIVYYDTFDSDVETVIEPIFEEEVFNNSNINIKDVYVPYAEYLRLKRNLGGIISLDQRDLIVKYDNYLKNCKRS